MPLSGSHLQLGVFSVGGNTPFIPIVSGFFFLKCPMDSLLSGNDAFPVPTWSVFCLFQVLV